MIPQRLLTRVQPKLLLSYLLVVAVGIGTVAVAVQIVAPSLFDRMLGHHQWSGAGRQRGLNAQMHQETVGLVQDAVFQTLLLAAVVGTVAAVGVSLFVSRRITSPIARMSRTSRRIAHGDYAARVPPGEPDEIGELGETLNALAAALQEAEQRRAALIADVAHEIRTPLATVSGYLEGLSDGVVDPSPALWAQLRDETGRLNRLVDDLQELSRLEAGGASIRLAALSPQQLVDAGVARVARAYEEKGVALGVEPPGQLPPVLADADRVVQVLTNLLTNALRYTDAGGSVVVAAAHEGAAVRFSVRDSGLGIAPEHLPRVFDRFYRADPARARAAGGSGIGLTIARAIVEAHGGRISAASEGLGRGSTFSFTLPAASES
jgi:signal transduction histidine kinase